MENHNNSLLNSILTTKNGAIFKPACMLCQDIGIVYYHNTGPGSRTDSGAWDLCECQKKLCKCDQKPPWVYYDYQNRSMLPCPAKKARLRLIKTRNFDSRSEIPARYKTKFFASIQADPDHADLMIAMEQSMEMIAHVQSDDSVKGLYLYGPTGCGKTLLSCAILHEILRIYNIPIKYAKISRDILGKLQASFNPNSEIYGEGKKIEEQLATIPALVIDDFGVHRESEWVNQVLYDLIDARYENNLLTVLTSNEPMSSWSEISDGRVLSRLKEMCREIHINMPDYRVNVHNQIQKKNLGPWK